MADVAAAFLQGEELDREVYLKVPWLPDRVRRWLEAKLGPNCRKDRMRAKKGIFGLGESPRRWYRRFKKELEALGFHEMRILVCCFALYHDGTLGPVGVLRAVLVIHVDDAQGAGDKTAGPIWQKLRDTLCFGSWVWLQEEVDGHDFCGRRVRQKPDFSCESDLNQYCARIPLVQEGEGSAVDAEVTEAQKSELMGCNGRLGWSARHGRPGESFAVSWLQQSLPTSDAASASRCAVANRVIRRARKPFTLVHPSLDCALEDAVVGAAVDASQGSMPRAGSQNGIASLLCNPSVLTQSAPAALVEWTSSRVKRVVRSSMACEAAGVSLGFEHGDFLRAAWRELISSIQSSASCSGSARSPRRSSTS
jgi:hypothetical protein